MPGTTKVKGLLDVTLEGQFKLEWKRLEEVWKGRVSRDALFLSYMNVNKRNTMKKCMIAETRTRCGLETRQTSIIKMKMSAWIPY